MQIDKDMIWLVRGSQRKLVFSNLPNEPFMPNKLRKELNEKLKIPLSLREMSRHLRDFEKRGFIQCINKDDPYNRIYILTKKGNNTKTNLVKSGL